MLQKYIHIIECDNKAKAKNKKHKETQNKQTIPHCNQREK